MANIAEIPSWLQVSPAQWGDAAAKGASLTLERDKLAMDAESQQRQAQFEAAKLKIGLQQQAINLQLQKQNADRAFQLGQQKLAVTQELAKQKFQIQSAAVAQKAQQQALYRSAYQQYIAANPNASPLDAALAASAASGGNPTELAAAIRANSQKQPVTWQPDPTNPLAQVSSTGERRAMPKTQPEIPEDVTKKALEVAAKEADGSAPPGSTAKFYQAAGYTPPKGLTQATTDSSGTAAATPVATPQATVPKPDNDGMFEINGKKMRIVVTPHTETSDSTPPVSAVPPDEAPVNIPKAAVPAQAPAQDWSSGAGNESDADKRAKSSASIPTKAPSEEEIHAKDQQLQDLNSQIDDAQRMVTRYSKTNQFLAMDAKKKLASLQSQRDAILKSGVY